MTRTTYIGFEDDDDVCFVIDQHTLKVGSV